MTNGSPAPADDKELERRKQLADVEKAEADAARAKAEADKATAEAAAAATAAAAADANLTNDRLTAAASNAKTIAEANSAAETARATAYSKLVPDLSAVKSGSLNVSDGPALFTSELSASALRRAGSAVADELKNVGKRGDDGTKARVLVTTEVELASADALNLEVTQSLTDLTTAAAALLDQIDTTLAAPPPAPQGTAAGASEESQPAAGMDPFSAVGALAQLVPGLLGLTSANRSVRTATVEANDLAAVAAVSGGLVAEFAVVHDSFRLIPSAGANKVFAAVTALAANRRELVARKITLGQQLTADDAAVKAANQALTTAQAALKANTEAEKRAALAEAVDDASAAVTNAKSAVVRVTALGSLVEGALSAIDALTADLHAVPIGATRSKLASAALYESLRADGSQKVDYVLLVRAEAGQTNQSVSDRALWLKDRVSVLVETAVTYLMISTADNSVIAAGTRAGVAQAVGELGSRLQITAEEVRAV